MIERPTKYPPGSREALAGEMLRIAATAQKLRDRAMRVRIAAEKGQSREMTARGGTYNGGWSILTSDYVERRLDNAMVEARRAARENGVTT